MKNGSRETPSKQTRVYVLNTGGTLGMTGRPLRPAKSAAELLEGVTIPKTIDVATLEDFPQRLDSTNIRHALRVEMAECLARAYDKHDAFLVLHGTDSLADTTAALCMIFKQSLQKAVTVTGAQMTKQESGTDMKMQLENSLRMCRAFHRHRVAGVFNVCIGDVLDGSRLRKKNDSDFNAFYTPGREPVALARPHVLLREDLLRYYDPVRAAEGLRLDTAMEPRVATIQVSADTPPDVLTTLVAARRLRGVILECKGAGNIPDCVFEDEGGAAPPMSWIDAIKQATNAGVHVGIISPFDDGRVDLNRYELGAKAKAAGALSLESLTPAMGDVKFRMAIAMHPDDPAEIQQFLSTNLVGELLPGVEDEDDNEE